MNHKNCAMCGVRIAATSARIDCVCGCEKNYCVACGKKRKRMEIPGEQSYLKVVEAWKPDPNDPSDDPNWAKIMGARI